MSYQARVFKVFIASPGDVKSERELVKRVLARWNNIHSQEKRMVLLPVTWETNAAPEYGIDAQDYINEELLDNSDMVIGIFWSRIGTPTRNHEGRTVEEIYRNAAMHKLTMLYFSQKDVPANVDLDQLDKVRRFKKSVSSSLYEEYRTEVEFEKKLFDQLQLKINEGKLRPRKDSDYISLIKDDALLVQEIEKHIPFVAYNVLENIIDQNRGDVVWDAIILKLAKSPADLRNSMRSLANKGAFNHPAFEKGTKKLAEVSQSDYFVFLNDLFSQNRYAFRAQMNQGYLNDGKNKDKLMYLIERDEIIE